MFFAEPDILYENGDYWVCAVTTPEGKDKGFEVYRNCITHSTRCAIIGYKGNDGIKRAIEICDKLASE